jgi:hypothetical protein
MLNIQVTGPASIEVEAGEASEDDGELEDFGAVHLEVPVALTLDDGVVVSNILFVNLEELPFEVLPQGPLPLEPTEEDSTLYVAHRHREVVTTRLVLRPSAPNQYAVELDGLLHLEDGPRPFALRFVATASESG